jgi:3-keto-disaccharide hydrolase
MTGYGRRRWLKAGLGALGTAVLWRPGLLGAAGPDLTLPPAAATRAYGFERSDIEGWTVVAGQWAVEDLPGAPNGGKALVQRATRNDFNVIVAPDVFTDVDVSVSFDPLSGREDASGGIVFRFDQGRYYVVRANALEDNFRLYYYDRGRRQLASASVKAPALGRWHTLRLVALADRMQAWLDGVRYLDHRDSRFKSGRIGLWTKADSVTAFHELTVRGTTSSSSPGR